MPEPGQATIDVGGREIKVGMGAELRSGLASSIPLGRAGTPQEAAGAIYLLCLEEASYISGEVLICGGGYSL
jgi:3-oxoacyl-[acyl-carrier protein] reductase